MSSILSLILIPALLPVAIILFYVYIVDRAEREPAGFLLFVFVMGAVFALPCAFIEPFLQSVFFAEEESASLFNVFCRNVFAIALVEEFSKWLVFKLFVWNNSNFNYRYDGIVYAVTASLGFAALENVFYIASFGREIALQRAIFAIPAHTTFGVFMGFFLARAKSGFLHNYSTSAKTQALVIPVIIHGTYDFLLSEQVAMTGYQFVFFILVIVLDFAAWKMIRKGFKTDREL